MILRSIAVFFVLLAGLSIATAQELHGVYLYKVSTVRAATGELSNLLDWIAAIEESGYYEDAGEDRPLVMRHSQGDQWDLLIITPMESWTAYYSESAARKRDEAISTRLQLLAPIETLMAFDEDHFAYGPPMTAVKAAYEDNSFYHIEMFEAAPGRANDLFEQRLMENAYLSATGQTANMIFRRAAGSDVDVFTIGFHKSLQAFATPAGVTNEEKEVAAKEAGFKGLSDISFYLRSLISGHHDTLAVKVK